MTRDEFIRQFTLACGMQSELVFATMHFDAQAVRIEGLESDLLFCVNGGDDLILDRDHWKAYARSLEAGYEQLDDEFAIDHSIQAERIAEIEAVLETLWEWFDKDDIDFMWPTKADVEKACELGELVKSVLKKAAE